MPPACLIIAFGRLTSLWKISSASPVLGGNGAATTAQSDFLFRCYSPPISRNSPANSSSKENPSVPSPGRSMSIRRPSIAASSQKLPYDSFPFRSAVRPGTRSESRQHRASGLNLVVDSITHHPVEHGLHGTRHPVPARTRRGHPRHPAALSGTLGLAAHQPHRRLPLGRTRKARQGWLQDAEARNRTPHVLMFSICPLSVVFRPFYVVTPASGPFDPTDNQASLLLPDPV
jgi:hypothetical protein